MSYTLSTTNWLAPILLPAAAASSSSRSVSEGPRPLPPPRTLRGARAGHYAHSPARGSRRGSIGKPDRSRAPPRPSAPTGPNRWLATWLARSGSGTSPGRQTRGERRGVSGGRAPGAPGAEPARRGGPSPPALWLSAAAPRSGPKMARPPACAPGGSGSRRDYSSRHAPGPAPLAARSAEAESRLLPPPSWRAADSRLQLPACRAGPGPYSPGLPGRRHFSACGAWALRQVLRGQPLAGGEVFLSSTALH